MRRKMKGGGGVHRVWDSVQDFSGTTLHDSPVCTQPLMHW